MHWPTLYFWADFWKFECAEFKFTLVFLNQVKFCVYLIMIFAGIVYTDGYLSFVLCINYFLFYEISKFWKLFKFVICVVKPGSHIAYVNTWPPGSRRQSLACCGYM